MKKPNVTWPIGDMGYDGGSFDILFDVESGGPDETEKCPHSISLKNGDEAWKDRGFKFQWIVPRVVEGAAEYCRTSNICLDCILDSAKSLEK